MLVFSFEFSRSGEAIDIADFIGKQANLDSFIVCNFDKVDTAATGLFSPTIYKVDFINRTDSLKFCAMSIQQCWVKRVDSLYAFIIIVKRSAHAHTYISKVYGESDVSALVSGGGDITIDDSIFIWRRGHLTIDLMPYYNISKLPKYDSCDEVILRKYVK
jgi:hypothetical protein